MTRKTILVTGAGGFVGGHVVRLAHAAGHRVVATGRESELAPAVAACCDSYVSADLAAGWPIEEDVDAIVHLAGLAAVGPSFGDPQTYIEVNSAIMTAMCESLLRSAAATRVIVVSSGAVYRPSDTAEPLTETSPVFAGSPYAIAKLLVERQAEYYASRGLDTVVARPFNHIGPGQGRGFLVPDLTAALLRTEPGEDLLVGDLETARDYTDVRDVARAYVLLAEASRHRHTTYNVASGASRSGLEVLDVIADALGRERPRLVVDESRIRPDDARRITGSAARLEDEFGWAPLTDWRMSVREYVEDARPDTAEALPA